MRVLLAICLALAAAWAGYWFIGSSALKSGLAAWFDARRAEGWVAEYGALQVQGFPSRFDTSFTALRLADPAAGLGWQAPFFQLLTLSYTPNHVIAVWPHTQSITTPGGEFILSSADMRASMVVAPSTALALRRATLTGEALSLAPHAGAEGEALSVAALRLAAERIEDGSADARYHLGLAATDMAPPAALMAQLEGSNSVPRVIDSVAADITVDFTAPWDRFAIERARPQPTRIEIARLAVTWGAMSLEASGALDVDARGLPEGDITLKARGWQDALEIARSTGALTPDMADTAQAALSMMAGGDSALDIPLRLGEGRVWLGPVPIAPAPVLRLQ
ncbi:DUF2125 domain-containing protein [Roseovarius sp. S4756]|uniref:DUF2125 domain-containing protein n=1 Tax=Roseovarius maritimus TaxID=3342637 RepID=UPI00372918AC